METVAACHLQTLLTCQDQADLEEVVTVDHQVDQEDLEIQAGMAIMATNRMIPDHITNWS